MKNLKNHKLIKNIIIVFISIFIITNIFATSHLPPALLNIVNQTDEYLNIATYLMIPFYSLISIINPLYLLLGIIFLTFSQLFFKKKVHYILFIGSFILVNTLTYYFQAGLIGIFMAKTSNANIIIYLGLLSLFIGVVLTYLIGLKKIKIKEFHIKLLALSNGIGFGIFFFQIPQKISVALKFALSYNPYFLRFLFLFKILFFLILSLLPMIYLIHIIKFEKYEWTKNVNKFFIKNKEKIIYLLIAVLFTIFILAVNYRNYLVA